MMKDIGDEILNEIIREDLVIAESEGVCVWKANAAEILEAIAFKHAPALFHRGMQTMWEESQGENKE